MLSQLITHSELSPFIFPTGTSVERPLTVVVIGATVTLFRNGLTGLLVSTSTGRALSSCAIYMGRTNLVQSAGGHHIQPAHRGRR